MGITSKLDPVLSFPLGANSISILEAALAYQTIMTGHTHPFAGKVANDSVPIIRKIQDRDGETIWEFESKPRHILSRRVSGQVAELLKLVVTHGTGRKAKDAVRLSFDVGDEKVLVPVRSFGKTGTANQYRNSSFVGFIPGPEDDTGRLGLREGYVIATYVGYDDNRPMKGKHVTVYGASGALPIWIDTAKDIVNSQDYKKNLQVADFAFDNHLGVPGDKEMRPVYVSPRSGLPTAFPLEKVDRDDPCINAYAEPEDNGLRLWRSFEPLQGANNES
jgi:membrane peptidoglycan carboxypeptidase